MIENPTERLEAWKTIVLFVTLVFVLTAGDLAGKDGLMEWGEELGLIGIGTLSPAAISIIAIVLLGSVEVIRASATTLGEEIGWRGFLVYELRKVLSFGGVARFSGLIWAAFHWPLLVYYSHNVLLEFITFFTVIISMSVIMAGGTLSRG